MEKQSWVPDPSHSERLFLRDAVNDLLRATFQEEHKEYMERIKSCYSTFRYYRMTNSEYRDAHDHYSLFYYIFGQPDGQKVAEGFVWDIRTLVREGYITVSFKVGGLPIPVSTKRWKAMYSYLKNVPESSPYAKERENLLNRLSRERNVLYYPLLLEEIERLTKQYSDIQSQKKENYSILCGHRDVCTVLSIEEMIKKSQAYCHFWDTSPEDRYLKQEIHIKAADEAYYKFSSKTPVMEDIESAIQKVKAKTLESLKNLSLNSLSYPGSKQTIQDHLKTQDGTIRGYLSKDKFTPEQSTSVLLDKYLSEILK